MKIRNGHGDSLLNVASRYGTAWVVTEILNSDFEIRVLQEALYSACVAGELIVINLLLDRGADVNLNGAEYGTALGAAAYQGDLDIVSLLLDRGADVYLAAGKYGSALGAAAYAANMEIIALFRDRGADVNLVGGD